jgi:hypothetical protein
VKCAAFHSVDYLGGNDVANTIPNHKLLLPDLHWTFLDALEMGTSCTKPEVVNHLMGISWLHHCLIRRNE